MNLSIPEDSRRTTKIRIAMNGVTGRVGREQHLLRAMVPLIEEGGLKLDSGSVIIPDPILVGRDLCKLRELSSRLGGVTYSTSLEEVLSDESVTVYFDAQSTSLRYDAVAKAIASGKHVYCEKPAAATAKQTMSLYSQAEEFGVRHGVVQDKLWSPGMMKLKTLIDSGFFGRVFSVRGEFGYWVFDGDKVPGQRPSWYGRKELSGGLITDMFCHWHYLLEYLFGPVKSVVCIGAIHIPERWDESGIKYTVTADDSAYALFKLTNNIIAQFNCSFCTRTRQDEILTIHVDGTTGSAVAGLQNCIYQPSSQTPLLGWNINSAARGSKNSWLPVTGVSDYPNPFKVQWELYLRHVELGEPFPWNLREGARGIQFAEVCLRSWEERRWIDLSSLN